MTGRTGERVVGCLIFLVPLVAILVAICIAILASYETASTRDVTQSESVSARPRSAK